MYIKKIIILILLGLALPLFANDPPGRLSIEFSGGFGSGWWIYNRGSDSPPSTNTLGWDRTPHSPYAHLGMSILFSLKRVYLGAAFHRDHFFEDKMWAFEDGNPFRDRYAISRGSLPINKKMIVVAVDIFRKQKFSMQPELRYGSFSLETLHPDRENFTDQRVWQIGIGNVLKSGRWELIFRPFYSVYRISLKTPANNFANHRIYHAGAIVAFRASFY